VYRHLKDLNNKGYKLKMRKLSDITEKICVVYSNTDVSMNEQIFFKKTLCNLTSYWSNFSHALKICEKGLKD